MSSRAFDQASTNLIYGSDSEDNGEEDESYSYAKANVSKAPSGGRANLGNIRSNDMMLESSTALLSEANMESSDVYIYGSGE